MEWVHRWCRLRADVGPSVAPTSIISSLGDTYMVPDDAHGDVTWRPDRESRAVALERARASGVPRRLVREALDAIATSWKEAGWTFPDSRPKALTHIEWLYRRLRFGESYRVIGERDREQYVDPDAIRAAVTELAELAGIDRV